MSETKTGTSIPAMEFEFQGGEPDMLRAIAEAAVAWWASNRPCGWNVEQHLGNPRINLTSGIAAHKTLAESVAAWVAYQRGIRR